jgi:septal ring factor EnvC (AmiA/AmiB activator)
MDQDKLRQQITQLHAELDQARQNNPEAREHLSEILPHVKRVVDQPQSAVADASLSERLENAAVQFEAAHPTLAASARRLIELLNEVGI